MGWTFYNSSGQRLSTAATSISVLDIDGATDIGADLVDADLFIIDDGAGGTNRKTAASRVKTYAATTQAVQSDIEAETNQDTYIPPDLMKHHPGIAKVWCSITAAGAIESPDYNVASVTDTGTGDRTIVVDVDFSGTIYTVVQGYLDGSNDVRAILGYTRAAGSFLQQILNNAGTGNADKAHCVAAFGDQ